MSVSIDGKRHWNISWHFTVYFVLNYQVPVTQLPKPRSSTSFLSLWGWVCCPDGCCHRGLSSLIGSVCRCVYEVMCVLACCSVCVEVRTNVICQCVCEGYMCASMLQCACGGQSQLCQCVSCDFEWRDGPSEWSEFKRQEAKVVLPRGLSGGAVRPSCSEDKLLQALLLLMHSHHTKGDQGGRHQCACC